MNHLIGVIAAVVVVLLQSCTVCNGKVVKTTFNPPATKYWTYISKFCYDRGISSVNVTVHRDGMYRGASLALYLDEEWEQALQEQDCEKRLTYARITWPMKGHMPRNDKFKTFSKDVSQWVRPHYWYLVMANCLDMTRANPPPPPFEVEVVFQQADGGHFSFERQEMLIVLTILVCAFTVFGVFIVKRLREVVRQLDKVHLVMWIFTGCVALEYAAIIFEWMHMFWYSYDGVGIWFFFALSQLLRVAAQGVLLCLFLLLSQGWTIHDDSITENRQSLTVTLAGVMIAQVVLVFLSGTEDNNHNVYHELETWSGYCVVGIRILFFLWFMWNINNSISSDGGSRRRRFYTVFALLGSFWFLAYPFVIFLSSVFAPYLRQKCVSIGLLIMQSIALTAMYNFFLTRGEYFRISTLSSPFLPGVKME
eukprot:GFYU01010580.1.p1 GENE.GFYU01010580.1~~GFYU01010580.1.p1  ORF type:complete len:422 (+),score=132.94 GFYU01010580.1:128-1393(+)